MKKIEIHPCASSAKFGDELELMTPGGPERYPVVGWFQLSGLKETVPVLGICSRPRKLDNYYFKDVLVNAETAIKQPYCLPIHVQYISAKSILKVIRKPQPRQLNLL